MSAFYYSHKYCADNFILKKCGVVSFKYLFENMRMKYKKKNKSSHIWNDKTFQEHRIFMHKIYYIYNI